MHYTRIDNDGAGSLGTGVPGASLRAAFRRRPGPGDRWEHWRLSLEQRFDAIDWAPDLAENIGSRRWFRGLATWLGLSAAAIALWPSFGAIAVAPAMAMDGDTRTEFRSQTIMPLALGSDSGSRMGPTAQVRPLAATPERPTIQLVATLSRGDSFARMLQRGGLGDAEAARVAAMVADAVPLSDIQPGTQVDITLGRRAAPGGPRMLEALDLRARFDLALSVARRAGGRLALERHPIRVDETPLRIRGTIGDSFYRSARAAGAPPGAVQEWLRAMNEQDALDRKMRSGDTFDLVVSYKRAATGEHETGKLLYAAVEREGKPTAQLVRWGKDGRFYEASGVGEQRSGLMKPVNAPVGSGFGMRRHPILGYKRMHSGLDYRAHYGEPIHAVSDGRVLSAGRAGGCGNAVKIQHNSSLATRYCHMSRMAVRAGQSVRRGQVIGYVGSTGLSTGPHLHFEMYRNGRPVNPASVTYTTRALLAGAELQRFKAKIADYREIAPGSALSDLAPAPSEPAEPEREIDKLATTQTRQIGG